MEELEEFSGVVFPDGTLTPLSPVSTPDTKIVPFGCNPNSLNLIVLITTNEF
jgi:hypothetical protein